VTCTKTGPKNNLFFNCQTKTKELSKKELSNVTPASSQNTKKAPISKMILEENSKCNHTLKLQCFDHQQLK
jgi:hypothetical protein